MTMKKLAAVLFLAGHAVACTKFSEIVRDETAGVNGSFEVVRSGLPVNWYVYTPRTIPTGDYDLVIDTVEVKDGRQSLKFVVRDVAPDGGRLSPGFSQEFDAPAGSTWTIAFWVRNASSDFIAKVGGVSGSESEMKTMAWSDAPFISWKRFEYEYTVPQRFNRIRFELNVVRAGVFWVDDFTITPAETRP
jgi:hypothetical protein